jgi:hypothetical protein
LALAGQSNQAIAAAKKGIEIARSTNQAAGANQLEQWMKHYQIETNRAENSPAADRSTNAPLHTDQGTSTR